MTLVYLLLLKFNHERLLGIKSCNAYGHMVNFLSSGMIQFVADLQIHHQSTQLLWMKQKITNTVRAAYVKQYSKRCVEEAGIACECRRISGCRFSPPKNNVFRPKRQNNFCDVEILSQSPFSS